MNLELSPEQKQLKDLVREFAENEIRPHAHENDLQAKFPEETIKSLGPMGLMGVMVPEEYGGAGMDPVSLVMVIEELARVDASTAVVVSVNNSLACEVILRFGNEAQKKKYLVPLADGTGLGAYCLTEPGAGSDASSQKATAVKQGKEYILNGEKAWITNGHHADTFIVFAMTDASKGAKGINAFIVEGSSKGIERGKDENKLGIRGSSTCTINLNNVKVPEENRLGDEGQGFKIAMSILDGGRIGIAAQAVGISQAALESAIKYSQERHAFGKPIGEFQGLRWMISDMATRVEASRLLMYQAAYLKQQGGRYTKYASIAKLFASETSSFVTNKAVQIHGGYGYTKEYDVERYIRDARITEIYEGTSEIQRLVIATNLLKEAAAQA